MVRLKTTESQRGSYTIEASLSLVFFIFAIVLVLGFIRVTILESILQNAVNNMAKEAATYSYLLVKCGINLESDGDSLEQTQKTVDKIQGLTSAIYNPKGGGSVEGIASALGEFSDQVKVLFSEEGLNELKSLGVEAAKDGAKTLINLAFNKYYYHRFKSYLPASEEVFKNYFRIVGDISFDNSRYMPPNSVDENTIVVIVECEVKPLFDMFKLPNIKITKYAFTAIWSGA